METIRLYRSEHAWIADFGKNGVFPIPFARNVSASVVWIADFGKNGVFPIPFARNVSASVVLAHVVERNPDAEVFIDFIGENPSGQPSPVQMFIDTVSETPEWMHSARGAA